MNFSTIPNKLAGDAFTQTMWATYIEQNGNLGFARLLAAPIVLGAPASTIDFSSIEADFAHLLIVLRGNTTSGNPLDAICARFNADNGAHYYSQQARSNGSTSSAAEFLGETFARIGGISGVSTARGSCFAKVSCYTDTTQTEKQIVSESFARSALTTGTLNRYGYGSVWVPAVAAAINEVTLLPSAGNFDTGTQAFVYGLPT